MNYSSPKGVTEKFCYAFGLFLSFNDSLPANDF